MPTLYKAVNIDISKTKKVPLNFKMRAGCPDCKSECVHDFKTDPLKFPEQDQLLKVSFSCPGCQAKFTVAAKIQNIRMVLMFDPDIKTKELS